MMKLVEIEPDWINGGVRLEILFITDTRFYTNFDKLRQRSVGQTKNVDR